LMVPRPFMVSAAMMTRWRHERDGGVGVAKVRQTLRPNGGPGVERTAIAFFDLRGCHTITHWPRATFGFCIGTCSGRSADREARGLWFSSERAGLMRNFLVDILCRPSMGLPARRCHGCWWQALFSVPRPSLLPSRWCQLTVTRDNNKLGEHNLSVRWMSPVPGCPPDTTLTLPLLST